ncbi:sugar-binding domain-containing protein, partial [Lactiplantibacillus plantarum]
MAIVVGADPLESTCRIPDQYYYLNEESLMLRPVETPTREIKKLDGLWAFSLDRENCGIDQRWWESALQESRAIAVPGSFNDQFADADIRNYAGNVWYQREVFIPKGWAGQRIV